MAKSSWVKTQKIYCERINQEVDLLEERIIPDNVLPNVGEPFQVRARTCSHWLDCNLSGAPCCYSGTNPSYDPFRDQGKYPEA
jgi:hypothetical protein